MLAHGDGLRRRDGVAHERARAAIGREGERRLDLRVFGEGFGARQVEGAARVVEPVLTLIRLAQAARHAVRVAEEEGGRVHEHTITFRRLYTEAPDDRAREGLFDGAPLVRVRAD